MFNKHHAHWSNRPCVYWLGLIVVAAVLAVFEFDLFNYLFDLFRYLKEWQTLTAGLIALFGAAWTVHTMRKKDGEEQKRKQRAAKFPLGEALSDVVDFSENGMVYLIKSSAQKSEFNEALSRETIEALKGVAEWFEGDVSIAAGDIGPKYQLCRARIQAKYVARTNSKHMKNTVICDFAELYALANRLFEFSRGKTDQAETGDFSRREINQVLFDVEKGTFQWGQQPQIKSFLDKKYGVSPH